MRKGTLKKALALALTGAVLVGAFAGCGAKKDSSSDTKKEETKKIVIGASPSPHADILKVAKKELKKEGYELEIKEYSDYVQPNTALESGDLDANYFQHKPYLDDFNKQKKTHLVSAGTIHYEPFGIFPGKTKTLKALKNGATVAVLGGELGDTLSGGEKQRIGIARAFLHDAPLLLMDEPYGQLDIDLRFKLEDELIKLWEMTKTTVIFITHNIEEAVYLGNRIMILTNKPTTVKRTVNNTLPRPRDIASPDFVALRTEVTDAIKWW